MLKLRKILLLKMAALGTVMGTLFINNSIGTEGEDKQENPPGTPFVTAEGREVGGVNPPLQEILRRIDQRNAIRSYLLSQPRTFDLGTKPIQDVMNHLYLTHQVSENVGFTVLIKKLTLLNIKQEQLNEIINNEYANHIEELAWTLQPPLVEDIGAYLLTEEETPKEESLKKLVDPEGKEAKEDAPVSVVQELLNQVDERTKTRQAILRQPRTIDLGVKPVQNVLNVLYNANKYSSFNDPIRVKLDLLNITARQLNQILTDPYANHIGEIDWTYQADLAQVVANGNQPQNIFNMGLAREIQGEADENLVEVQEGNPPVFIALLEEGEEVIQEGEDQEEGENQEVNGIDGNDENIQPRDIPIRRRASRRIDPLLLSDLKEGGQENNLVPDQDLVEDKAGGSKKSEDPEVIPLPAWGATPIDGLKEGKGNLILENILNVGNSNAQARHASHNLVNIYCRHVPGMVAVH